MHLGAVDDEIARRGSASSVELARRFEAIVLAHRDEVAHPDPETAVDVAFRMAYCTFARQVMYGPEFESERTIAWDDLVAEVGGGVRRVPAQSRTVPTCADRAAPPADPSSPPAVLTDGAHELYKIPNPNLDSELDQKGRR